MKFKPTEISEGVGIIEVVEDICIETNQLK